MPGYVAGTPNPNHGNPCLAKPHISMNPSHLWSLHRGDDMRACCYWLQTRCHPLSTICQCQLLNFLSRLAGDHARVFNYKISGDCRSAKPFDRLDDLPDYQPTVSILEGTMQYTKPRHKLPDYAENRSCTTIFLHDSPLGWKSNIMFTIHAETMSDNHTQNSGNQ